MGQNILITGAAGYMYDSRLSVSTYASWYDASGGSIVTDFISRTSGPIKGINITAPVRTEEQVENLSKLGINAIHADLSDEAAITKAVLTNESEFIYPGYQIK